MPGLPQNVLRAKLQAALPTGTRFQGAHAETRPAVAVIRNVGKARVYLWTLTHVETKYRSPDEFKIQLIIPGQERGEAGELEFNDSELTLLLGYSPDYGVFVGWEAQLHKHFGYSATVQVREDLLIEARDFGWAVAPPRRLLGGEQEVRVAFSPGNLLNYIRASQFATSRGLSGATLEAFFLRKTPKIKLPSQAEMDVDAYIPVLRERLNGTRLKRDSRFGFVVREQFSHACALCSVQLNVVEAAHIIPINEEHSEDEMWNGVALCRNHHRLFDAFAFIIQPTLKVQVDESVISFLEECGRANGADTLLLPYGNKTIRKPRFYSKDSASRRKMQKVLAWRESLAAIQAK